MSWLDEGLEWNLYLIAVAWLAAVVRLVLGWHKLGQSTLSVVVFSYYNHYFGC